MSEKTLYIFVDESGNFDFSPNGSKYFILSCLLTFNPVMSREKLIDLKYKLLEDGMEQEYFHATEDRQIVRDKVFEIIKTLDDVEVHSVVAQKNKTNPVLHDEDKFYKLMCKNLLQYLFRRAELKAADKVVVVLGALFTKKRQSVIIKTLKKELKERFNKPFGIYFHQVKSDINCQLADYCGWSIYIKWERADDRSYKLIEERIKSEFDIFQNGKQEFYVYKK